MISKNSDPLVFLLSMPRSGSTLLSLMLGSHPEVLCPPEPWIQLALSELTSSRDRCRLPFDEDTATIATAAFFGNIAANPDISSSLVNELHNLFSQDRGGVGAAHFAQSVYNLSLSAAGKRIFIDKTPRYYHVLDFIDDCYPAAKKIVLKRNPLDIALSYKTTWNVTIDEIVGQVPTANTVDFAKGLFELERYGAETNPNVLVVGYEDLVLEPETVIMRLCEFLGMEYSPQMLAYHNNASLLAAQKKSHVGDRKVLNGGRKTDTASIGRWRQGLTREEISRLVNFFGGSVFSRLGYQQTLEELKEDGIELPVEGDAERSRASALAGFATNPGMGPSLGNWAYIIASAGADSKTCGELLGLLARQANAEAPFSGNWGELTFDFARLGVRCWQLAEQGVALREWAERSEATLAAEREVLNSRWKLFSRLISFKPYHD